MKQVTAVFTMPEAAKHAVEALTEASFAGDDISMLKVDKGQLAEVPVEQHHPIRVTAPIGAIGGATIGLALAVVGGIPGLLAAGPVLAALQGIVGGTAAGTLVGTLAGLGWWKTEADIPVKELEAGGVLVGIRVPNGRVGEALEILSTAGASRVVAA
jgi:hypothetical protein